MVPLRRSRSGAPGTATSSSPGGGSATPGFAPPARRPARRAPPA